MVNIRLDTDIKFLILDKGILLNLSYLRSNTSLQNLIHKLLYRYDVYLTFLNLQRSRLNIITNLNPCVI